MTAPWALEAKGLHKRYRLSRAVTHDALRGIDLRIAPGESVAIVGRSGSGKSTLLNLLGTLDRPTQGKLFVDGVDTSTLGDGDLAELRNKRIGFIFQNYSLIARMTAIENVALPMVALGVPAAEREERARKALQRVGLGDKLKNRPVELSGGEQQRVAVARSLVNEPAVLLADEPTGNLDTKTSRAIIGLLKDVHRSMGVTLVVVTHDMGVAEEMARVVHLKDGRVERDERKGAATPGGAAPANA